MSTLTSDVKSIGPHPAVRSELEARAEGHTPVPWHTEKTGHRLWAENLLIANLPTPEGCPQRIRTIGRLFANNGAAECQANAAFIVLAANSHEALVKALEAALSQLVTLGGNPTDKWGDSIQGAVIKQIDAALALAHGRTE